MGVTGTSLYIGRLLLGLKAYHTVLMELKDNCMHLHVLYMFVLIYALLGLYLYFIPNGKRW